MAEPLLLLLDIRPFFISMISFSFPCSPFLSSINSMESPTARLFIVNGNAQRQAMQCYIDKLRNHLWNELNFVFILLLQFSSELMANMIVTIGYGCDWMRRIGFLGIFDGKIASLKRIRNQFCVVIRTTIYLKEKTKNEENCPFSHLFVVIRNLTTLRESASHRPMETKIM